MTSREFERLPQNTRKQLFEEYKKRLTAGTAGR